jgi:hypothetical protein
MTSNDQSAKPASILADVVRDLDEAFKQAREAYAFAPSSYTAAAAWWCVGHGRLRVSVSHQHQRATAACKPAHCCSIQTVRAASTYSAEPASRGGRRAGALRKSLRDPSGSGSGCAARPARDSRRFRVLKITISGSGSSIGDDHADENPR